MGRYKLCRLIIVLKAGEAAGRPRLSTFSAEILNGWQKLGSQKEAANDRKWALTDRAIPAPGGLPGAWDIFDVPYRSAAASRTITLCSPYSRL